MEPPHTQYAKGFETVDFHEFHFSKPDCGGVNEQCEVNCRLIPRSEQVVFQVYGSPCDHVDAKIGWPRSEVAERVLAQTQSDDRRAHTSLSKECPSVSASIVAKGVSGDLGAGNSKRWGGPAGDQGAHHESKRGCGFHSTRRVAAHTGHEAGRGETIGIRVVVWQ